MVIFTAAALIFLGLRPPAEAAAWQTLMGQPVVMIATGLYLIALLWHAWIGIRDVLMDYVRQPALKFSLLSLAAVWLWACGLWGGAVLLRGVL